MMMNLKVGIHEWRLVIILGMTFMAMIAITVVDGGSYYNRYAGKKAIPTTASSLTNLSMYTLSSLSSIAEPSVCAAQCNTNSNCKMAQHRQSTQNCVLLNVAPEGSNIVELAGDSDFTSFTLSTPTIADKSAQSSGQKGKTNYFDKILNAAKDSPCWNQYLPGSISHPTEPLDADNSYISDLGYSSNNCTPNAGVATLLEPASFLRLLEMKNTFYCMVSPTVNNNWWAVDMQRPVWITSFYHTSKTNMVYTFRITYSMDGITYQTHTGGAGVSKAYAVNSVASYAVGSYTLHKPIFARYLKMIIHSDDGRSGYYFRCLKLSFNGCPAQCMEPLGVENNQVGQMSVDGAMYDPMYPAATARLNWGLGGLRTQQNSQSPSLIVDLEKQTIVRAVQTQGCKPISAWTSSFRVQYRQTKADDWKDLTDVNTGSVIFPGNTDATTVAVLMFSEWPVVGQFFKVTPKGFSGSVCFKVELLGCRQIPRYLTNLAQGKTVAVTSADTTLASSSAATDSRLIRHIHYQNCTRVLPTTPDSRAMLVVDLGSSQAINSVEITTPNLPPRVALNPDGLWLLDVMRFGDDLSGNGNHAILSSTFQYGAGFDGRPMGAVSFPSQSIQSAIFIPLNNIRLDPQNGWTFLTWLYIDSMGSNGVRIFRTSINAAQDTFSLKISQSGQITATNVAGSWSFPNPGNDSPVQVAVGRWMFVGFTIDCQSGVARVIVDSRTRATAYFDCPNVMTLGQYGVTDGSFVGRVSCMQIYKRSLDQSEIEQASLCPWLNPAPVAIFPFNCAYSDILGSGMTFDKRGSVTCESFQSYTSASLWTLAATDLLYINISSGPAQALDLQYSFTVLLMFWEDASSGVIFGWYRSLTAGDSSMYLALENGVLKGYFSCRGTTTIITSLLSENALNWIRLTRWYQFGLVYDYAKSKMSLVIDGIFVKTISISCANGLATDQQHFAMLDNYYHGNPACLQFYKAALTAKQIYSLRRCPITSSPDMTASLNTPLDGIWGRASQDDGTQTQFSTETSVSKDTSFNWATNHYAYKFLGGSNSYVQTGTPVSSWQWGGTPSNKITVAIHANNLESTINGSLYNLVSMTDPAGPVFLLRTNPNIAWSWYCLNNGWETPTVATMISNSWQHHMLSFGGGSYTIFQQGYKVNSAGTSCNPKTATSYLSIGTPAGNTGFNGLAACLVIFPYDLDQYRAQEIMTQCPAPSLLQGHVCEADITMAATVTFSSTWTSGPGLVFNGYVIQSSTTGAVPCCWVADTSDSSPWIQADFGSEYTVASILTQGDNTNNCWVNSFYVQYRTAGSITLFDYLDRNTGTTKSFTGNSDATGTVYHFLRPFVVARQIVLRPVTNSGGKFCLRLGIRGCPNFFCNAELFESSSTLTASSAKVPSDVNKAVINYFSDWQPTNTDLAPYFQIVFAGTKVVTAIHMQGSINASCWITKFHLLSSVDGASNWIAHTWSNNGSRIRIFNGPLSGGASAAASINFLNPPLIARGVRVVVDDYNNYPGGRFGFKGCPYSDVSDAIPSFKIRTGSSSAPTSATDADSMTRCGGGSADIGPLPYGSKTAVTCDSVSSRYVGIVSSQPGAAMVVCQVAITYDAGTNFAALKSVTASSDISAAGLAYLTDGQVGSGQVDMINSYSWLILDLGVPTLVSKIILATSQAGQGATDKITQYDVTVRVGNNNNATLNAVCDFARDFLTPTFIQGMSLILHCTPSITGRYVSIEKISALKMGFSEFLIY